MRACVCACVCVCVCVSVHVCLCVVIIVVVVDDDVVVVVGYRPSKFYVLNSYFICTLFRLLYLCLLLHQCRVYLCL